MNDSKTLANLNQKQAAAKVHVDRLQKRNEIIARIEKLKVRIPIAKYTAAQAETRRLKDIRNDAKVESDRLKERDKPLQDRATAYEKRKQGRLRLFEKASESLKKTLAEIKACENKSVTFEEEALDREREIRRIRKEGGKRKAALEEIAKEIRKLEHAAKKAQENLERLGPDDTAQVQVHLVLTWS